MLWGVGKTPRFVFLSVASARDIMKSWPTAGILGKYRSEKLSKIHFIFFYLKVH